MSRSRSRKIILTLTGLWLLLYASFTLFRPPLLDDADSVHAEVAREMVVRHDWITLYANGIRYLEKAPLHVLEHGGELHRLWARGLGRAPAAGALCARSFPDDLLPPGAASSPPTSPASMRR